MPPVKKSKDAHRYVFVGLTNNKEILANTEIEDKRTEYILKDGRRLRQVTMFGGMPRKDTWYELKSEIIDGKEERYKEPMVAPDIKKLKREIDYKVNISGRELNLGEGFEKVFFETYIIKKDKDQLRFFSKEFYLSVPNIEEIITLLTGTFMFEKVENIKKGSIVDFINREFKDELAKMGN